MSWSRGENRLADADVQYSSIAPAKPLPGAFVLVFRDPDNIQLELFADASDIPT